MHIFVTASKKKQKKQNSRISDKDKGEKKAKNTKFVLDTTKDLALQEDFLLFGNKYNYTKLGYLR